MVGAMTERKRRQEYMDSSSHFRGTVKRHKTQGSISLKERKDKLGEKISALQQLVSPFGKTDTASVLLEATGYIKFLQEQVQVLSAPYLQSIPRGKPPDSERYGLQSRGLCLVPVTWTCTIARSNGADIWAPAPTNSQKHHLCSPQFYTGMPQEDGFSCKLHCERNNNHLPPCTKHQTLIKY